MVSARAGGGRGGRGCSSIWRGGARQKGRMTEYMWKGAFLFLLGSPVKETACKVVEEH